MYLIPKILILFAFCLIAVQNEKAPNKIEILKSKKLPPCKACKTFTESFNKALLKTEKGKFEGGDAAWEEEKLGSYAKSEVRLVEIQENLCQELVEGQNQCFTMAEMHDSLVEDWWFKEQDQNPDLFDWLCVKKLEYCCAPSHYGPECLPCPGHPDKVCNNNGVCKGAGTRKGNGKCACHDGYQGDQCESCAKGYYQAYKDENKMLCSKCHQGCKNSCTEAGIKGCDDCADGWMKDPEKGCIDINECTLDSDVCNDNQFCVNNDGSFKCLDCDRSCVGCTGDGPDMCNECARGYTLSNNMCVDAGQQERNSYVTLTRYLTYAGLCIATCIILQRNVILAAVVGLAVAIYISTSEYMLATGAVFNYTNPVIDSDSLLKLIR